MTPTSTKSGYWGLRTTTPGKDQLMSGPTAGYQLTEEDCQTQELVEREGEVYAPGVMEKHLARIRRPEAEGIAAGTHTRARTRTYTPQTG